MNKLLCLALAASLSACAAMPGVGNNTADNTTIAPAPVTTRILDAIERADAAYQRAKPEIDALIALLPPDRQAQAKATLATVDYWLAQARLATTAAQAVDALRQAAAAMQQAGVEVAGSS